MKYRKTIGIALLVLLFFSLVSNAANYRSFFAGSFNENEIKYIFLVVSRIFRTFYFSSSSTWWFGTLREPGGHLAPRLS